MSAVNVGSDFFEIRVGNWKKDFYKDWFNATVSESGSSRSSMLSAVSQDVAVRVRLDQMRTVLRRGSCRKGLAEPFTDSWDIAAVYSKQPNTKDIPW